MKVLARSLATVLHVSGFLGSWWFISHYLLVNAGPYWSFLATIVVWLMLMFSEDVRA